MAIYLCTFIFLSIVIKSYTIEQSCDKYIPGPVEIQNHHHIGNIILKDLISISFQVRFHSVDSCCDVCNLLAIDDYSPRMFIEHFSDDQELSPIAILNIQMMFGDTIYEYLGLTDNETTNFSFMDQDWHTIHFETSPDYDNFAVLHLDNVTYEYGNLSSQHDSNGVIGMYPYRRVPIYTAWSDSNEINDSLQFVNATIKDLCINSWQYKAVEDDIDNDIVVSTSENCMKHIQGPFQLKENQNHGTIELRNTTEIAFSIKLENRGCCCQYCHILSVGIHHPMISLEYDYEKENYGLSTIFTAFYLRKQVFMMRECTVISKDGCSAESVLLDLKWHQVYLKISPR